MKQTWTTIWCLVSLVRWSISNDILLLIYKTSSIFIQSALKVYIIGNVDVHSTLLEKNQNNLSLSQIERTWICSQTAYFFHSAFEQNIPPLVVFYDKLGVIKRLSCITVILLSLKFWILAVQLYFIHMYVQIVTTFVVWSIWTIFLKFFNFAASHLSNM